MRISGSRETRFLRSVTRRIETSLQDSRVYYPQRTEAEKRSTTPLLAPSLRFALRSTGEPAVSEMQTAGLIEGNMRPPPNSPVR